MSEIKLNLVDAQQVLIGNIHGSVADAAVAALSAEPETLAELEAALARFIKPLSANRTFEWFRSHDVIDDRPWDAGIVIIDLAARLVALESSYSMPGPAGQAAYHDGVQRTNFEVMYRLSEDWKFVHSIAEYEALRKQRAEERAANPPIDTRAVLYGRPLSEWIAETVYGTDAAVLRSALERLRSNSDDCERLPDTSVLSNDDASESANSSNPISNIHGRWLLTPREDLRGQSPRDVLFEKRDFVDFDLNSRELQWSFLDEGPPCLSVDSIAYRFAGFGTHEWVIYYDLVRHLLWSALISERFRMLPTLRAGDPLFIESAIAELEAIKSAWLEQPQDDYDNRVPAILIENERKRLPIAMSPREMIVDENCPTCQLFADETALGLGVGFWHLDGCNMDDDFVFSHHGTRAEWEAERREWKEFSEKFNREWEEKQQRIARGEEVEGEVGNSRLIIEPDGSITDLSETDDHAKHKVWGPRGWIVS